MPTYVYKFIDSGETIEVQQSFQDPTLTELAHPSDGVVRAVKKVFQPVGVTFKGSGFYKTDSRNGSSSKSAGTKDASSATTESSSAGTSTESSSSTTSTSTSTSNGSSSSTTAPSSTPAAAAS